MILYKTNNKHRDRASVIAQFQRQRCAPMLCSEQLADILSVHVCSKLHFSGLQALSLTCKMLRHLVSERLPASTWKSVASNALPLAHPWLSLPGSEIRSCLERSARAKPVLPEPIWASIWEGWEDQTGQRNIASALNHQASQLIMYNDDSLSIHQLTLADKQSPLSLITTKDLGMPEADMRTAMTHFLWSNDDSFVAVQVEICNAEDSRAVDSVTTLIGVQSTSRLPSRQMASSWAFMLSIPQGRASNFGIYLLGKRMCVSQGRGKEIP
ncbi:hypothetical protein WJX73_005639 [Symbiochloris irregularis]|uniref:F-box domain-containing protein n=1 Tax=Symbiochloris irregularis TaxID=706552 RepID=A0AAW1NST8_9CHLO